MSEHVIVLWANRKLEEYPLQVFQDDDELKTFKVYDQTDGVAAPLDLTSATVELIVKENFDDVSALFTYTSGGAITIASPNTSGIFTVQFARTDLDEAGVFRYQLRVTQSSKRRTIAFGDLIVENT